MATKKSTRKKTAPKKPATSTRKIRPGFISHTELASTDPRATKEWCQRVLGWKFGDPMPTPAGPYYLWSFGDDTGGGIRGTSEPSQRERNAIPLVDRPETPGSIPYCEVPDIKATYERALKAGATGMFPPDEIPGGNGWLAIVQAPGGVAIGFWGPK